MHVEDKEKKIPENTIFLPDYDVSKKGQKKTRHFFIPFLDESEKKKILKKKIPAFFGVVQLIDLLIAMGILFIIIIELMWCRPWSPIFGE